MSELLHLDLFCGAGGFSTGLRPCGYRTVVAVEMDRHAAASFRRNHPDTDVIRRDIRAVTGGEVAEYLPLEGGRRREVDLVTAGCPCQTFSRAGTSSRSQFGHRQTLFAEVIRIATATRAKVICLENVRDILDKEVPPGDPIRVADLIRGGLATAGYTNQVEGVSKVEEHAVPQGRSRWFLVASRVGGLPFRLPVPGGPRFAVADAFAGLPRHAPDDDYTDETGAYAELMRNAGWWRLADRGGRLTQHATFTHAAGIPVRYAMVKPGRRVSNLFDGLDPVTLARLQALGVLPNKPFNLSGDRLHPRRPGFTVTGNAADRMIHPRRNRAITVREAARLQSFPDAFEFVGPTKAKFMQIGNAVPPLASFHLGLAIREALTGTTGGYAVPLSLGAGPERDRPEPPVER